MNRDSFNLNYQLGNVSSDGNDSDSDSDSGSGSDNENSDMVSLIATGGVARKINIPQDKLDVVNEHFFLSLDSKDRKYTNGDTTFNFNIESLKNIYKNIASITIQGIIVPNIYLECQQVHGLYLNQHITTSLTADSRVKRPRQLRDLNYITLQIENIPGKMDGNNEAVRQSIGVFILDRELEVNNSNGEYIKAEGSTNYTESGNKGSSLLAGTNYNNLVFKTLEPFTITFDTPIASLFELKLSLRDPFNNVFRLMNDYLTIMAISIDSTDLRIKTNEYFSPEEYRIGNNLIFSDIEITSAPGNEDRSGLINFLTSKNRTHPIMGYAELEVDTPVATSTKLFNTLIIGLDYTLNRETGAITSNNFNITGSLSCNNSSVINSNLQTSVFVDIETQKNMSNSLIPRMI